MNKLSDDLQFWRADRPSEWKMDDFIRAAKKLEDEIEALKKGKEKQDEG